MISEKYIHEQIKSHVHRDLSSVIMQTNTQKNESIIGKQQMQSYKQQYV